MRMGEELVVGEGVGFHHLMVWDWSLARRTQAAMLASWSSWETMRVECGGRERMRERLEKSWVVEGPITGDGKVGVSAYLIGYQYYDSWWRGN